MLEIRYDMPENVVSVSASGTVTGEDYKAILLPAIEEKLAKFGKIRILYILRQDFSGVTIGAMWNDAKAIIKHLTVIEKAAVVSDVKWIIGVTTFLSLIIPYPVKTSGLDTIASAQAWIRE